MFLISLFIIDYLLFLLLPLSREMHIVIVKGEGSYDNNKYMI